MRNTIWRASCVLPLITLVLLCIPLHVPTIRFTMSNQKRRSAAKPTVTISGFALGLGVFVERVQLMENRAGMACLKGVTHRVEPGNTLEIQYGSGGGILSVVWVGQPCTERAGMIGARWLSANETAAPVAGAIITDASDEGDYAVAV